MRMLCRLIRLGLYMLERVAKDSFTPYSTTCAKEKAKDLESRLKSSMQKVDEFDRFRGSILGCILYLFR